MKEIAFQKRGKTAIPFTPEDLDRWSEYKDNQVLRCKVSGFRKQRSVEQLGLFMACCALVADNTDNPQWNTQEKVKFQVKVALHFVDESVVAVRSDGTVVFQYRSLSFSQLQHMEACRFFDRAFDVLADFLGVSVTSLIETAQEQMGRR